MELLPFGLFGLVFVALIVWFVRMARADRKKRLETLARLGFAPCQSDAERELLVGEITRFEHNAAFRYRVDDPMRAPLGTDPVWFYIKERSRQGSVVAAPEFRFPFCRDSSDGVVLFFKPSNLRSGTSATLIGKMTTSGWDSQPDDLTRLEVPPDLGQTNLIGILAPAGASLFELIDPKSLATLECVADHGIMEVRFRDGWCCFSSSSTRMKLEIDRIWSIIEALMRSSR